MALISEQTLAQALSALSAIANQIVVVGGSASRLFPHHPLGCDPGYELLTTEDLDIAMPLEIHVEGGTDLLASLTDHGFVETTQGYPDPTSVYRAPNAADGYVQFIAPLTGSGVKRGGNKDRLLQVSGVRAEKLRSVDILLQEPWSLELELDKRLVSVQVVNPMAYLLQKLLILQGRPPKKQAKDILYVYDTLMMFRKHFSGLQELGAPLVDRLTPKQARLVRSSMQTQFVERNPRVLDAAEIAKAQRMKAPNGTTIALACETGLSRVFPEAWIHE